MGLLDWLKGDQTPQKAKTGGAAAPARPQPMGAGQRRDPIPLLSQDEPPPYEVVNPDGPSKFLLVCDHASHRVPASLKDLGVRREALLDHVGWDPGAANVARHLAAELDATLILSNYSRLVIDCNRKPGSTTSIPAKSDTVRVPGNEGMDEDSAKARAEALFWPYHRRIEQAIDERLAARRPTVLVSIHSFTPALQGKKRPWEVGFMYGRDDTLAQYMIAWTRAERPDLTVGDNQPYQVNDSVDYTVPVHGESRGLYAMIVELRNNEIDTDVGVTFWGAMLAAGLRAVEPKLKFVAGPMSR